MFIADSDSSVVSLDMMASKSWWADSSEQAPSAPGSPSVACGSEEEPSSLNSLGERRLEFAC